MLHWQFTARCKTCGQPSVIFERESALPPEPPIAGEFGFGCGRCGVHNRAHSDALIRKPADDSARAQAS